MQEQWIPLCLAVIVWICLVDNFSLVAECLRQIGQCQPGNAGVGRWPLRLVVEMDWCGRRSAMAVGAMCGASLWKAIVAKAAHLPILTVVEQTEK